MSKQAKNNRERAQFTLSALILRKVDEYADNQGLLPSMVVEDALRAFFSPTGTGALKPISAANAPKSAALEDQAPKTEGKKSKDFHDDPLYIDGMSMCKWIFDQVSSESRNRDKDSSVTYDNVMEKQYENHASEFLPRAFIDNNNSWDFIEQQLELMVKDGELKFPKAREIK